MPPLVVAAAAGPLPCIRPRHGHPARSCFPTTTVAATHLPFTNGGVAPSPPYRRGRAIVGTGGGVPWPVPPSAAPTRLRSPSPWWRPLRLWRVTMSTTPSRPMTLSTAKGVARPAEGFRMFSSLRRPGAPP